MPDRRRLLLPEEWRAQERWQRRAHACFALALMCFIGGVFIAIVGSAGEADSGRRAIEYYLNLALPIACLFAILGYIFRRG